MELQEKQISTRDAKILQYGSDPNRLDICPVCAKRAFTITRTKLIYDFKKRGYDMDQFLTCKGCNSCFRQSWWTYIKDSDFPGECGCGGRMLITRVKSGKRIVEVYECGSCKKKKEVKWIPWKYEQTGGPETSIFVEYHEREDYMKGEDETVLVKKTEFMRGDF
jgi:hypothetical protein